MSRMWAINRPVYLKHRATNYFTNLWHNNFRFVQCLVYDPLRGESTDCTGLYQYNVRSVEYLGCKQLRDVSTDGTELPTNSLTFGTILSGLSNASDVNRWETSLLMAHSVTKWSGWGVTCSRAASAFTPFLKSRLSTTRTTSIQLCFVTNLGLDNKKP